MKNIFVLKARKTALIIGLLAISFTQFSFVPARHTDAYSKNVEAHSGSDILDAINPFSYDLSPMLTKIRRLHVYDSLHLNEEGLSFEAFEYGIRGMEKLADAGLARNTSIISIADFSQPSANKRLYIVDLDNYELLFRTWVAHGRNSGKEMAQSFSNKFSSYQSSLGFYLTSETYRGSHGYSLKLEGMEKGINDNARERAIVMHAADYVNEGFIRSQGYIGRSLGCPAVAPVLHKKIIEEIKGGSCFFIYYPSQNYLNKSFLLADY